MRRFSRGAGEGGDREGSRGARFASCVSLKHRALGEEGGRQSERGAVQQFSSSARSLARMRRRCSPSSGVSSSISTASSSRSRKLAPSMILRPTWNLVASTRMPSGKSKAIPSSVTRTVSGQPSTSILTLPSESASPSLTGKASSRSSSRSYSVRLLPRRVTCSSLMVHHAPGTRSLPRIKLCSLCRSARGGGVQGVG